MPHINYDQREIVFKIVYYGPGLSGKTTNLVQVHRALAEDVRGEMVTLDTDEERTLFFDFFPLDLGKIEGYGVRFNMYTVPGQIYYEASRRLILDGADGVVFVADSQQERLEANIDSFRLMQENLASYGIDWKTFPLTLQYNKRDVSSPIAVGTIEEQLNLDGVPVREAVAVENKGVMETIRNVSRQVIGKFQI
jgi:hypothetical protein